MNNQLEMKIDDIKIFGTLDNSQTTQEFLATLPREMILNRYGDREYYGHVQAFSQNGENIPDFKNGDICYYPAGPSLAIFFDKEEVSSQPGLIKMGEITTNLEVFKNLPQIIHVSFQVNVK